MSAADRDSGVSACRTASPVMRSRWQCQRPPPGIRSCLGAAISSSELEIHNTTVKVGMGTGRNPPPHHMGEQEVRGTFQHTDSEIAIGTSSECYPARTSTPFIETRSYTQTQARADTRGSLGSDELHSLRDTEIFLKQFLYGEG